MCQESFNGVSGGFQEVSRKFQECLKKVSRVFQGSFKGVSRKIERYFKVVFIGVQGCLKEGRWLLGSFKPDSRKFLGNIEWCFGRPLRMIQGRFKGI